MGFDRPAPAQRTSLDRELRAVLLRAAEEGLTLGRERVPSLRAEEVWLAYTSAQLLPAQLDAGLEEVGRRYGLQGLASGLHARLGQHVENTEVMGLAPYPDMANEQMQRAVFAIGASTVLDLLPDQEFLTGYQDAIEMMAGRGRTGQARARHMREHAERVFRLYGLPYVASDEGIEWSGDQLVREEVVEPALVALETPRVSGARAEFVQARAALRGGTADKLRDATHEAGNAVEAVLHALLAAYGVKGPRSRTAASMFNALRDAGVIPASLESTVMSAPQLRNAQGGHTQGATVTEADQRLAETAVASAAVAITALVGYLP